MFNKFCRRLLRVIIYNSIIKGVISWFIVRNIHLVFIPVSGTGLLNLRNFLSNESYKGVSGYMNNVTFGSHVRMGASCQENQPGDWKFGTFNPTLSPTSGRERRERLNQSVKLSDLISHTYVMKLPQKCRGWFQELLGWWTHGDARRAAHPESVDTPCPFPIPCPVCLFHLVIPNPEIWLSFAMNLANLVANWFPKFCELL